MAEKNQATPPDFESAMQRLEQITGQMESGQMPLHELLERYEEGTKLIQYCQETLQSAEKRIEMVTRKMSEPTPTAPAAPAKSPKKPDPDVSLF